MTRHFLQIYSHLPHKAACSSLPHTPYERSNVGHIVILPSLFQSSFFFLFFFAETSARFRMVCRCCHGNIKGYDSMLLACRQASHQASLLCVWGLEKRRGRRKGGTWAFRLVCGVSHTALFVAPLQINYNERQAVNLTGLFCLKGRKQWDFLTIAAQGRSDPLVWLIKQLIIYESQLKIILKCFPDSVSIMMLKISRSDICCNLKKKKFNDISNGYV